MDEVAQSFCRDKELVGEKENDGRNALGVIQKKDFFRAE
jgi:hypothetical protein